MAAVEAVGSAKKSNVSSWQPTLSLVFDVLIKCSDRVVDDTALERLLSWIDSLQADPVQKKQLLDKSTNISQFLSQVCANENETPMAFALRLAGILFRHADSPGEEVLERCVAVMNCAVEREDCWSDPIVRSAYFKALHSAIGDDHLRHILLRNGGKYWLIIIDDKQWGGGGRLCN